jgi:NAD(P)-dependent dehydrogenase (short-subunit alcohol dehydrogenase family)
MTGSWLAGKRLVIIGGTSGMGLSAALACIEQGARVIVTGRNETTATEAQHQLADSGRSITSDATKEGSAEEAIEMAEKTFGGFDGLYHVAGGSGRKFGDGPLHEITYEGWQHTLNLNLTSLMLSNRAAVRYFLKNNRAGVILNMGSVLGFSPSPKYFTTHTYAAAKSAIIGFTKSIAAYYAPNNIRVNVIAPALIETPMSTRAVNDENIVRFLQSKQPLDGGRTGIPEDTDGLAVFLLSDQAKFITGQVIAVDGGWSVTEGQY